MNRMEHVFSHPCAKTPICTETPIYVPSPDTNGSREINAVIVFLVEPKLRSYRVIITLRNLLEVAPLLLLSALRAIKTRAQHIHRMAALFVISDLRASFVWQDRQHGWMLLALTSSFSLPSDCTARTFSSPCPPSRKLLPLIGSTTAACRASLDDVESASAPPSEKGRGLPVVEGSPPSRRSEDSVAPEAAGVLEGLLCVSVRQGGWVTRPRKVGVGTQCSY